MLAANVNHVVFTYCISNTVNIYYSVFIQYVYTVACCYIVVFLCSCSCVMCWCHERTVFSSFKLRGINDIKILGQCFPVRPLKDNERKSLLADQGTRQLQELTITRQRRERCLLSGYIRMRVAVRRREYVRCPPELLHCRRNVKGARKYALEKPGICILLLLILWLYIINHCLPVPVAAWSKV